MLSISTFPFSYSHQAILHENVIGFIVIHVKLNVGKHDNELLGRFLVLRRWPQSLFILDTA